MKKLAAVMLQYGADRFMNERQCAEITETTIRYNCTDGRKVVSEKFFGKRYNLAILYDLKK